MNMGYVLYRDALDCRTFVSEITKAGLFQESVDEGDALRWTAINDLIYTLRVSTVNPAVRAVIRRDTPVGWHIGRIEYKTIKTVQKTVMEVA
jgi:hypothetical protein